MTTSLAAFFGGVAAELRWRLLAAVLASAAMAFTEGASVLLLVPLLGAIGLAVHDGATGGLARATEAAFGWFGVEPTIGPVLVVFVLVSAAQGGLYRLHLQVNPALEQRFALALRERFYAAVVRARWPYLMRRRTADVVHLVTSEIDRAGTATNHLLALLTAAIVTAVYGVLAFTLSPALTAMVIAGGGLLLWVSRHRTRRSAAAGDDYLSATREQFHFASESLQGLKVARVYGLEPRLLEVFGTHASDRAAAYLRMMHGFGRSKAALDLSSAVLVSVLLFVAVTWLQLRGASLLVLVFVFSRVMPRMTSLQASAETIVANLGAFSAVMRTIRECEAEAEATASGEATPGRVRVTRELRVDGVSYAYDAGTPVLREVSLSIPAGRMTAIVGASGAGKSTLADILTGLLRPDAGGLLADGVPLTDGRARAWRRSVSYVPQDGFLLHGSIRRNLAWVKPDATDADMWEALERAAAAAFVRARPEGLDTIVGDRGVMLSGGERQRLALARALLTRPEVLLLDEATSAVDPVNERLILGALRDLAGSVTVVDDHAPAERDPGRGRHSRAGGGAGRRVRRVACPPRTRRSADADAPRRRARPSARGAGGSDDVGPVAVGVRARDLEPGVTHERLHVVVRQQPVVPDPHREDRRSSRIPPAADPPPDRSPRRARRSGPSLREVAHEDRTTGQCAETAERVEPLAIAPQVGEAAPAHDRRVERRLGGQIDRPAVRIRQAWQVGVAAATGTKPGGRGDAHAIHERVGRIERHDGVASLHQREGLTAASGASNQEAPRRRRKVALDRLALPVEEPGPECRRAGAIRV